MKVAEAFQGFVKPVSYFSVRICGFQLKFGDGLPHSFLDPHTRNLEQRQGVVHWLDGNVERLGNLDTTYTGKYKSILKQCKCNSK